MAVQNVSRVGRVRLARGAKSAPLVTQEMEQIWTPQNVVNVNWVKQLRFLVLPRVKNVI
jgi:hypothetical protein